MHSNKLSGVLGRYKNTLREVEVDACTLYTGCWMDVMRLLKANLELVELRLVGSIADSKCRYELKGVKMVVDYVMHGGELLPRESMALSRVVWGVSSVCFAESLYHWRSCVL